MLIRHSYVSRGCLVEALLYVHGNRRLMRDGEPRAATSTFRQLPSSVILRSVSAALTGSQQEGRSGVVLLMVLLT